MDDTELGRVYEPALTSVSLGTAERGAAAARAVLARLEDDEATAQHVVIGPRLLVRASSGVDAATEEATR
jgi:LacI family transcriptional regulator